MTEIVFQAGIELPYLHRNNALSTKIARGLIKDICTKLSARAVTFACLMLAAIPFVGVSATEAAAETRSLKLYYIHTREKAVITFKRNGKYDQKGLQELNRFLRDWRRNQPTRMDPRLFDLVWEVYRRSGATDYINVVSAFRSPETNGLLRSRTKGVAEKSQHMLGKAMDFYIPGVKLARLREIGMQMQIGGVGFYPTSGSPFVHMDVGGVRAWPRMSRQELVRIFPNGNTLHLPSDGKPLPGYEQALADYKKRVSSSSIQVASSAGAGPASSGGGKRKTLLQALFGGGDEDEDPDSIAAPAPAERPAVARPAAPEPEPTIAVASAQTLPGVNDAPLPTARPAFGNQPPANTGLATALYSPARNAAQDALQAATTPTPASAPAERQQFADLAEVSVPVPTLLGPRGMRGDAEGSILTASVEGATPVATGELASVPVPANRPAVAEALLAAANADPEGEDDLAEAQQGTLSPTVVAALEQSGQAARSQVQSAAMPTAAPFPAAVNHKVTVAPVETAKAEPQAGFGDAFDLKPAINGGLSAGLPTKGSRPSKQDAAVSQQAMVGGGRLTQDLISDWALNQNKGTTGRSVKAPRVVANRMLSNDMSASATSASFKPGAAAIESSRFSTPVKMH
ncbi:DUF882 domain-containing protein [Agrobacterium salinitolerans]|uniref:Murein endopeptidase K n=2 Tax=Agrobacterium salinitolerans TaxID=1183413 RepID=A0A9X3KRR5_9HYPH|nr:DUF882 domain-containing protein [Agrobacterium salinitolerans]MCZ7853444.1 DUF882 domain-containing protein [Agrobacterium salinitolerans]MCZ7892276.1 DUF882 domain-containing protein [Agrobacterium salinitolerans]MCZ7939707.1 DUF882 domain-containing protein [Agrobacterium salinitolerans]MCZ7974666.1 DUF882 domain-containing protein [Agrobacterium salinitolerans]